MFGLGPMEIGIVVLVGVLLFGNRLPKLARSLGSSIVEFKKGFTTGVEEPVTDIKREFDGVRSKLQGELSEASQMANGQMHDLQRSMNRVIG